MKIEIELGDVSVEIADALKEAIDPKGNIVLRQFGKDALLYRPANHHTPFVVASGYDNEAGDWSSGSYFSPLGQAYNAANPEIIEDACVVWQREDIRQALEDAGIEPSDENITSVIFNPIIKSALRANAIENGWETIRCAIDDCLWRGEISHDDELEANSEEHERPTNRQMSEHDDR